MKGVMTTCNVSITTTTLSVHPTVSASAKINSFWQQITVSRVILNILPSQTSNEIDNHFSAFSATLIEKSEGHFTFSFFFLIIPILVVLVLTILALRLVSIFLMDSRKKCEEESEQIENREVRIETQDDDLENKLKTDDVTESDSGKYQLLAF